MVKTSVFIMFCCVILSSSQAKACDVCGCSPSLGVGLLTDYKSNFLRFGYFHTVFKSRPEHDYLVVDQFRLAELSLRYAIKKNIRLMADLPFGYNSRDSEINEGRLNNSGIGDLRLVLHYTFINQSFSEKSSLYWEAGGGVSLPTGKYDKSIHNRQLPENFNISKGAMGYIMQSNVVANNNSYGFVLSNKFRLNGRTPSGYKFGNQFTTQLTSFKEIAAKKVFIIPNIGLAYETSTKDQYANQKEVHGTGGNGLFFSASINFKNDTWLAGVSYATPLSSNYSNGEVKGKGRFSCQVSYLF